MIELSYGGSVVIEHQSSLKFSDFSNEGIREALKTLPEDSWVLAVGYDAGDVQPPAITGSCFYNEDYDDASLRELREETGLVPKQGIKLELFGTFVTNKTEKIYKANIKDLTIDTEILSHIEGKDDRKRKVGVLVYGTKEDMMERLEDIIKVPKNDDIVSAYILSKNDSINIHNKANELRKKKKKSFSTFLYEIKIPENNIQHIPFIELHRKYGIIKI